MSRPLRLMVASALAIAAGLLMLVASGCGPYPYPNVSTTVIMDWDPDYLTVEEQVEKSAIVAVGTIVKIDGPRWNSPDGEEWSPSEEQTMAVFYSTFYVQPTVLLKGTPEWGTPIAFRLTNGIAGGDVPLSVGSRVVVFGASDQRYGGTYQPAEAYWLTMENNSIWIEKGGLYRNQGYTKDPAEANMSLEALTAKVAGFLDVDTSTTGVETLGSGSEEGPIRAVLSPYHNAYGDLVGVYVDSLTLEVDPVVTQTGFPSMVPAYRAVLRPLPDNDLDFSASGPQHSDLALPHIWRDPEGEELLSGRGITSEDPLPLHGPDVALAQAESFLREHQLWQPDLLPGVVREGSSEGDGTTTILTSWGVSFAQAFPAEITSVFKAPLPGALSVVVGPLDRPILVKWSLLDLTLDGNVRLRPLAEVIADEDAWRDGDISPEVNEWLQPDQHLAVTGVSLGLVRVNGARLDDEVARYLVPVYQFAVEPIGPDGPRGKPGLWTVVAAQDVAR